MRELPLVDVLYMLLRGELKIGAVVTTREGITLEILEDRIRIHMDENHSDWQGGITFS